MSDHKQKLDAALAAYESARDVLYDAASEFAYAETAIYSRRYPTRVVGWSSGMGTCSISVEKRDGGCYMIAEAYGDNINGREIPPPEFMAVLARIENDTRLPGIGDGSFTFKNGEELT